MLAIRPDELDFLTAAGPEALAPLLDVMEEAIESTVRAIDVISRSGHTRFEVVLPDTGPEGADAGRADPLRIDSTRPGPTAGRPTGISVSIGVAAYPADGADDVELGGNRTLLFSLPPGAPRGWAMTTLASEAQSSGRP